MKKILVQTNSTTATPINQQANAPNRPNQRNSNPIASNERNQTADQPASNPTEPNATRSRKQQIELDKQLEKQRMKREYRQSSANKSQESSNQLDSFSIMDFKTKTRGLSLNAGDRQQTQDIGLVLLNKLFSNIKTEHGRLIEQYGQKGPTKYDQYGQQCKKELEKSIYKLLPLFMKTFNCSINETMPEMRLSFSMQSFNLGNHTVGGNKGATKNVDIFEQFNDLPTFAQIISRLMVNEIRKRASQVGHFIFD